METIEEEYAALMHGCGFAPMTEWSTVTLTGADRAKFLHNMCTNDINRLNPGQGCEAYLTDVKGKILGHVIVLAQPEQIVLLSVPQQSEKIISHLDRYIIREDVVLQDLTEEKMWRLFVGNGAKEFLEEFLSAELDECNAPLQSLYVDTPKGGCLIVQAECFSEQSFLVQSPVDLEFPPEKIVEKDAIWEALRIEAAYPLFERDFDSTHLPQEVNRDKQAISFNKGCYLGQETVARIDALGRVNKVLRLIKFAGTEVPEAGTALTHEGKEVGLVTSSCWSPRHEAPMALAMVKRGANKEGTELENPLGRAIVLGMP